MLDYDCIGIKNSMLKLRKMLEIYKDFRKLFYKLWIDAFYNYTTILIFFFEKKTLDLYVALDELYSCIYKLSTIYKWKKAVFPIAIEAHTFIVA